MAGTNLLDSGAHFYEVYETKDGLHVAVYVPTDAALLLSDPIAVTVGSPVVARLN